MKHSLHTRILALVMAIAIVLSTGVLNSAGWLLASGGEQEETSVVEPTESQPQQGDVVVQPVTIPSSDPSEGSGDPTESSVPSESSSAPAGETSAPSESSSAPAEETGAPTQESSEPTEVSEPASVTLRVVLRAVYSDGKAGHTIGEAQELVFAEGEQTKTFVAEIPNLEGYTFATSMTARADGKYETVLSRPSQDAEHYITVTYTPVEAPEEAPAEGSVTLTVNVTFAYLNGEQEATSAQYPVIFAADEQTKDFTFTAPTVEGYTAAVDDELFTQNGSSFTASLTRPEADDTYELVVLYCAEDDASDYNIEPTPAVVSAYVFVVDGTEVDRQWVKNGDTVYAPASPEKEGYKFTGWFDAEGNAFAAGAVEVTGSVTYTYTARFEEVHYVFFMDTDNRVAATKEGIAGDVIAADVTFPVNADEAITGWYTDSALTSRVDSVTLESTNVTLYPKVETGHWITYDSDGGTYIAPVFVAPSSNTAAPAEPTREGYTFQGWYNGDTVFTFGGKLTVDITLTAQWQGNPNTQYTVIHWQENADDDNFSFKESETMTGTTGEATAATAKSYEGFTAQTITQQTIAGDESTIVNVYYDRNEYTINFWPANGSSGSQTLICGKEEHTHNWRCYDWRGNLTCTKEVHTHDSSCYQTSSSGALFTITAKYGASIGDQWPTYNGSSIWSTTKSGGPYQTNIDTMPLGGADFYAYAPSGSTNEVPYYVEAIHQDGSEGTRASDGLYYVLHHSDSSKGTAGYRVTDEDRYPITGFTVNTTLSSKNGDSYGRAKFYYYRNSYEVKFINNGSVENTVSKKFQEDISDVSYTPTRPVGIPAEYEFVGWYDNELGQGEEYMFSGTMPAKNITVYAKWAAPTYTGTAYLTMGGGDSEKIEISYGATIDESALPSVTVPNGFTWRGWATRDADGNYFPFNFNTKIYSDITLYPYYTSNQKFTVSYDAGAGTGTVTDAKQYADGSFADVQHTDGLIAPEGKVFLGWQYNGKTYQPGDKIQIQAANITFTAIWGDKAAAAILTYKANYPAGVSGAPADVTDPCLNNETVTVRDGFTAPEGYEFVGWATSASATTAQYQPGSKIVVDNKSENILYAVWKQSSFRLTIHYVYEGGAKAADDYSAIVNSGNPYSVDSPVIAGYTPSEATVTGTMGTADVERTVTYTKRTDLSYTVYYYWNGTTESVADSKPVSGCTFGETYPESPITVTGYTPVSTAQKSVTVGTGTNEIIFYYYKDVTLTANSDEVTYNRNLQSVDGFTPNDITFEGVTAHGEGTDADTYPVTFSEGTAGKVDTTGKYIVADTVDGTLTITKSDGLSVSGTPYEGVYDAEVHGTAATASVTEGTTVSYSVDGGTTWSTDVPTIKDVGEITVQVKAENSNYETATASYTLKVTPKAVTVTADNKTKTYGDADPELTATVSGTLGTDTVSYSVSRASGEEAGSYTITPSGEAAQGNYTVSYVTGTLTITKSNDLSVSGTPYEDVYDAEVHGTAATASVTEGTTVSYSVDGGTTWSTDVPTIKDVGEITVQVKAENSNYETATASYTLKVTPRAVTLTSGTPEPKLYDGKPLTMKEVTVTSGSFVEGEGFTYNVTGSRTIDGESNNTFTYALNTNTKAINYTITTVEGKLKVLPRTGDDRFAVQITANSGEHTYDGTEFTVSGFASIEGTGITGNAGAMTFVLNGVGFSVKGLSASASAIHVNPASSLGVDELPYSSYEVPVTGEVQILDEMGHNVTSQFNVQTESGTLTIIPRDVTLTSSSATKVFDDKPLTKNEVKLTSGTFAYGEFYEANVTGSQTRIGSSENRFTYKLTGGAEAQDYSVTYIFGTLTVTPPEKWDIVEKSHEDTDGVYKLGDEIRFTITVENIFDAEAKVTITEQPGVQLLDGSGNKIGTTLETTLAAGETLTIQAVYTVQEKDLLNGSFTNEVNVSVETELGELTDKDTDQVEDLEDPNPKLTVVKTTTSKPQDSAAGYSVGETIRYQITVENTGNITITDIQVTDSISGVAASGDTVLADGITLAPGEKATYTFEHVVTEEDLGSTVVNEAIATGKNPTEKDEDPDNDIPTTIDDEKGKTEDDTVDPVHSLSIVKEITNPKEVYKLTDTIRYQITVTNNGNVTERNVTVEDTLTGAKGGANRFKFVALDGGKIVDGKVVFETMAPGTSRVITCEYRIVNADEGGTIVNTASVTSDDADPETSEAVGGDVEVLYDLYILYVDEDWKVVAPNYFARLSVGDRYSITSPVVEGYTANRKVVMSGEKGMPAKDVWEYVIYTKDEVPEEPVNPGENPTDPSTGPSDPSTEPTYDLTPITDEQTPLANVGLEGDHTCCLMHFLIMLVSMITLGFYTSDRKKLQKSIFEVKKALKAEGVDVDEAQEEKA